MYRKFQDTTATAKQKFYKPFKVISSIVAVICRAYSYPYIFFSMKFEIFLFNFLKKFCSKNKSCRTWMTWVVFWSVCRVLWGVFLFWDLSDFFCLWDLSVQYSYVISILESVLWIHAFCFFTFLLINCSQFLLLFVCNWISIQILYISSKL